ncbi:MAG: terminase large subunit [Cetobacterium sp.]
MNHLKWCLAAVGFTCVPWMAQAARDLYGTLDYETGKRVYKHAYISMAKKNAKSSWCGWAHVYHLSQQHREGNRAISVATTRKQAAEVFDGAAMLIHGNPSLRDEFQVIRSSKVIRHRRFDTRYEVLSGDGDENDGVQSSQWIRDELHRFRSARAIALMEAVERSSRGKPESLGIDITTAGDPTESRPWLDQYNYAKSVQSGRVVNRHYYTMIFEADQERLSKDPEYWQSKEARIAANPSHKENGGFIEETELLQDMEKARELPSQQRSYFRFTLNAMAESESKMFSSSDWAACGGETHALLGRRCYAGVDLSSTTDLTALVALFPSEDGSIDVLPFFWAPSERIPAIAKMLGPFGNVFRQWVKDGLIETTDGNQVDYRAVEKKIAWLKKEFQLVEVDYDPWNAADMIQRVQDTGVQCVEIPQGIALSPSIKELQKRVLARTLRHGNHPVLAWMASCAKVKADPNENLRLVKAIRNEEAARVDGIAATVCALVRLMTARNLKSVYETCTAI